MGECTAAATRASGTANADARHGGLFRAFLAGPGGTLTDAFASLDRAPGVQPLVRHPLRRLVGARIIVPPKEGEGSWEFTQIGDDVYVVVANFAYETPRMEFVPGDGMVQFFFQLSGDLTIAGTQAEPLHLNRPALLVYFQPPEIEYREWAAATVRERCVAVNVRPEYLASHFSASLADSPAQLGALASASPGELEYRHLPLNSRMFELASQLIDNPYTGTLALIHTEAITLELLCAAVAEFSRAPPAPLRQFSEHELRCLYAARTFLAGRISSPPTTRHVARAVGMSETSLKRGFKALFGETLFDFSLRCRMQHALKLLREQHMSAAQVAEAVGYGHQSSFTTAFRRQFGLCPKDARGLKSY